jgi:hypothetical protein
VNTRRIIASAAAVGILVFPGGSGAEPSQSTAALIQELIEISGGAGMSEQMLNHHGSIELSRIQQQYGPLMELAVSEQTELSEEDRQRLLTRLADWDHFAQRFYELFVERVDFTKIIQTVYQPLYDKYFSADELEKIVAFYRTPAGRKLMESIPALTQEASQGVVREVQPQVVALIQEIFDEARAQLED